MDAAFFRLWGAELVGRIAAALVGMGTRLVADVKRRRRLVIGVLMALFISSVTTMAQTSGDPLGTGAPEIVANAPQIAKVAPMPPKQFSATNAVQMIDTTVQNTLNSLRSQTLVDYGSYIANSLLAFTMLWAAVKMLAAGKGLGDLFGEWIPLFIGYGVVTALVTANGAGDITKSFDKVIELITGYSPFSSLSDYLLKGVGQYWDAMFSVLSMPMALHLDHWYDIFLMLPDLLAFVIAKLLAGGFIAIAAVVYIAVIAFAHIGVGITTALAPLFVPFIIFKPTEFLFKGWLMSLLGANMIKLATGIMVKISSGVLANLLLLATYIQQDANVSQGGLDMFVTDLNLYVVMVVFALLAAVLMFQAPQIGMGLLSGSAGGFAFHGIHHATSAATKFSNASSPVAQGAWNRSAGKWTAAQNAKSDAKKGLPSSVQRYTNQAQHRAYISAYTKAKPKPAKPDFRD